MSERMSPNEGVFSRVILGHRTAPLHVDNLTLSAESSDQSAKVIARENESGIEMQITLQRLDPENPTHTHITNGYQIGFVEKFDHSEGVFELITPKNPEIVYEKKT